LDRTGNKFNEAIKLSDNLDTHLDTLKRKWSIIENTENKVKGMKTHLNQLEDRMEQITGEKVIINRIHTEIKSLQNLMEEAQLGIKNINQKEKKTFKKSRRTLRSISWLNGFY